MKFELTQSFYFEAAHTLERAYETESSRRIHGHTYLAKVTVCGQPHPQTGMVVDLAQLRTALDGVRQKLDHHMLDDIAELGPATLENLCRYIHLQLQRPDWTLTRVEVSRSASGDACCLTLS